MLAQTLNGLIRPVRGRLAWMPPGRRHQHGRCPQAGPDRTVVRMEQGREGAGALPSARQQRMLVLAARKVDARQRRLKRLLRVPDDVDDFGRHVHAVNVRHDVRPDRHGPKRLTGALSITPGAGLPPSALPVSAVRVTGGSPSKSPASTPATTDKAA